MSWFLTFWFMLPLVWGVMWMMSVSNHGVHEALEQTQVDAVALSLCHSRKNDLIPRIQEVNHEIELVQESMDAIMRACEAAPPVGCAYAYLALMAPAATGAILEAKQFTDALTFSQEEEARFWSLAEKNELSGKLTREPRIISPGAGLYREILNPHRQAWQMFTGIQWPKKWLPSANFESRNSYSLRYLPQRVFLKKPPPPELASQKPVNRIELMQVEEGSFNEPNRVALESKCSVRWVNNHTRVRRLK